MLRVDGFRRLILSVFLDRGQRSQTFWSQSRCYTTGELSTLREPQGRERVEPVYGANSSGAPFDAR